MHVWFCLWERVKPFIWAHTNSDREIHRAEEVGQWKNMQEKGGWETKRAQEGSREREKEWMGGEKKGWTSERERERERFFSAPPSPENNRQRLGCSVLTEWEREAGRGKHSAPEKIKMELWELPNRSLHLQVYLLVLSVVWLLRWIHMMTGEWSVWFLSLWLGLFSCCSHKYNVLMQTRSHSHTLIYSYAVMWDCFVMSLFVIVSNSVCDGGCWSHLDVLGHWTHVVKFWCHFSGVTVASSNTSALGFLNSCIWLNEALI